MLASWLLPATVSAHGNMVWPATWHDPNGAIGTKAYRHCETGACMYFTNYTFIDEPTYPADSPLRSYAEADPQRYAFSRTPWAAPGTAPLQSPCGVQGGNINGCPAGDENSRGLPCPGGGIAYGEDALKQYGSTLKDMLRTKWTAGSIAEANWVPQANHGGGYSYRLAKLPEEGVTALTEEMFQAGALQFSSNSSWIQWGEDESSRVEFTNVQTADGIWARDPIPACKGFDGGAVSCTSDECTESGGYQFDPPAPGVGGFGEYYLAGFKPTFGFNVVDKLKVPADLTPGNYVLSFRWDCEQTTQVWSTCADIQIVA